MLGSRDAGLLRPPYGHQSLATWRLARAEGYRVVMWSIAARDWRSDDGATLASRILAEAAPGAIVLLHDSLYTCEEPEFRDREPTIAALGILAERLPGWRFVTVSDLLAQGRPEHALLVAARQGQVAGAAEIPARRGQCRVKKAAR